MEAERVSWVTVDISLCLCVYVCACVHVCVSVSSTPVQQAQRGNKGEQVGVDVGEASLAFLNRAWCLKHWESTFIVFEGKLWKGTVLFMATLCSSISVSVKDRCIRHCHHPFDLNFACLNNACLIQEFFIMQWEKQWKHVFTVDMCPLSVVKQPSKPNFSLISLYHKGCLYQSHKGVNAGTLLINNLIVQFWRLLVSLSLVMLITL